MMLQINKQKNDNYCWICHAGGDVICCDKCPRVYHNKCMPSTGGGGSGSGVGVEDDEAEWTCVECEKATEAARLGAEIAKFTRDRFYVILEQMVNHLSFEDSRPFQEDVDLVKFSNYSTYVFRPTSLATLRRRVAARDYASFEAMRQDLKWILHNCIVYNGATSKLTPIAKSLLTIFESDVLDINTCADCFLHMMTGDVHDWFTEPCVSSVRVSPSVPTSLNANFMFVVVDTTGKAAFARVVEDARLSVLAGQDTWRAPAAAAASE